MMPYAGSAPRLASMSVMVPEWRHRQFHEEVVSSSWICFSGAGEHAEQVARAGSESAQDEQHYLRQRFPNLALWTLCVEPW